MPLVSVLMPIYNTNTSHLKSAIESILCQSFTDFEFLIYNDGSTDTSLDGLINSFIDKRISYYSSKKNIGISQVRNLMVSLAKGKYLAVMDHDDIAVPNRFKLQVEFLEENPDVGICGGFQKRFGSILKRKIVKYPTSDEEIRVSLFFYCAILHPSSMIRSSVLREHKISYDEALISANDRKLFIDISEVAKLANINQIIHLYRFHASNTSKTKRKSIEEQQIILRRYLLGKINVRLSEAEEDLFNNAFMKGRVKIKSLSTLNQLVDLAEKLIKANELSGYYPKDIFKKHCKKYLIKRLKNAVFYGRLNSYSVAQSSPLLKNEKLPFLVKISKFL